MLRPLTTLGLVGLAFGSFGCVGSIDQAGGSSPTNPSGSGPGGRIPGEPGSGPPTGPGAGVSPGGLPSDADSVPGPAPLRRLTRFEYENTVRDLLGLTTVPKKGIAGFSADQESASSGYVRGGAVTAAPDARVLMQAAEELAGAALQQVSSLLPCSPLPTAAAEQDACADKFVASFGRRAYRRPLTDAEVKDLRDLYRAQRTPEAGADFQQAVGNVITAMLQSPYFLYRWEVGAAAPIKDGLLVRFNQHETASRLSYLIWASMPDDKLFEAADTGKLATADQVAAQARRLLADARAKDALQDFHLQWLNMGGLADMPKDPSLTDVYTPEVAQAMLRETREFVASVFQGPKADGKLETLMTAQASFANAALAKIYGLPNVTGADLKPVSYNPAERAGLFTQGTFLSMKADAIDSHPIKRGDTMLNKVLCIPLEVPASIMVPPLPEPQPGQTTRERVSIHSEAACATCHKLIDPIGFAFENYDAIARYRAMEEGKPVDASGVFPLGSGALTFKNAVELLPQLARTPEARDCMVTQWWRYALRRNEAQTEEPSMKLVREAFAQSGYDMRELLVAFTRTRAFSHRKPSLDEVLP
jgi:hypothetical protein